MKKLTQLSSIFISSLFIFSTANAQYRSSTFTGRASIEYKEPLMTLNRTNQNTSYMHNQHTTINEQPNNTFFVHDNYEGRSMNTYHMDAYRINRDRYRDFDWERKHSIEHRDFDEHRDPDRW